MGSRIPVIIRAFKARLGAPHNGSASKEEIAAYFGRLEKTLRTLLSFPSIGHIYVVNNGDAESPLSEHLVSAGVTPTCRYIIENFPSQVTPLLCSHWGRNPGSILAVNFGVSHVIEHEHPEQLLIMSATVDVDEMAIRRAVAAQNRHKHPVVGFYRRFHWQNFPWALPQNTLALWKTSALQTHDLFDTRCNGDDGQTIDVQGVQMPLAGMEDVHLLLRMMRHHSSATWGMVGRQQPFDWDVSSYGPKEMAHEHRKRARQGEVVLQWAREIFPKRDPYDVVEDLFRQGVEY